MKKKYLLSISFLLLMFFGSSVYGGTYYVGINGSDSNGNGSISKPWRSINNALKNVKSGDTVSINDGTYSEGQLVIPAGVSLTSTSQNNTKVKVQPNISLYANTPFLSLSSASPGSYGNQTVSYIELDGINGSFKAQAAILVQNRNNVRIHHCNIHDFTGTELSINIKSTQIGRTANWWDYWPANSQAPGNDTNINALWPSNPVENFEFDNNTVTNCCAIGPYNLKNSSFHHNTIDNRNTWGWCFKGTCAFMDNVDIHDNILLAYRQDIVYGGQTPWNVELWMHRNGCEYYSNIMNGYYSITIGKETKIYNNTIEVDPLESNGGTAIEFNGQSYSEIYGNRIIGSDYGVRVGTDMSDKKNWIVEHVTIRNNIIQNHRGTGIRVQGEGAQVEKHLTSTVRYIDIIENIIDGQTSTERGDQYYRGVFGVTLTRRNNAAICNISNINVKRNIIIDMTGYAGLTEGVIDNVSIDSNNFYGNQYDSWKGSVATNTDFAKPAIDLLSSQTSVLQPPQLRISTE